MSKIEELLIGETAMLQICGTFVNNIPLLIESARASHTNVRDAEDNIDWEDQCILCERLAADRVALQRVASLLREATGLLSATLMTRGTTSVAQEASA